MNKPYKIGAIGAGMILNAAHLPAYVDLREEVILTAVYDPNRETAKASVEAYKKLMLEAGAEVSREISVCESADELLGLVDMADICCPSRFHAFYSEMALARNVHVMSEKPMSRNWLESERLVHSANRSSAIYQLNDDNVFLPRYQYIKNAVNSGAIGDIVNVWITRGTPSSGRSQWFFEPVAGGGAILDYGSHAVTGSWFLIGLDKVPVEVRSTGIRVKDRTRFIQGRLQDIETDDDAHFKVLYRDPKNGDWINVMIEATWAWPDFADNASDVHGWLLIEGTEGSVTSIFDENDQEYIKITNRLFGEKLIPINSYRSETLSFRDEILNFIRCVDGNRQSVMNAEICAQTMKIINAAQLSELKGRVNISMEEAEEYCRSFDVGGDILEIGDRIALELTKPYRLP